MTSKARTSMPGEAIFQFRKGIRQELVNKAAGDRLRELRMLIPDLLGPKYELFREFDRLVHTIAIERERAFFDLGFEHGAASSRAHPTREASHLDHEKVIDGIAHMIREWLLDTGLPPAEAVLLFIESMWIVALEVADVEDHAESS